MTHSTVLIVPAPLLDAANQLAEVLGWGPSCYSVPLSASGKDPATHYGLHTWAEDGFLVMVANAQEGIAPEGLAEAGFSLANLQAILSALIMSVRPANDGHFDAVCAEHGLKRIEVAL